MHTHYEVSEDLFPELSPREREVFSHILAGHTNAEVAEIVGISPRTIEVHRQSVMQKLKLNRTILLAHEWHYRRRLGAQKVKDRPKPPDLKIYDFD